MLVIIINYSQLVSILLLIMMLLVEIDLMNLVYIDTFDRSSTLLVRQARRSVSLAWSTGCRATPAASCPRGLTAPASLETHDGPGLHNPR